MKLRRVVWCAAALAASGAGCGSGEPADSAATTVRVAALIAAAPDGRATVDLRTSGTVYVVDRGVDLTSTTLICPNGQRMQFSSWVAARSQEFDVNYSGGFSVVRGSPVAPKQSTAVHGGIATAQLASADTFCPPECFLCTDGACICPPPPNPCGEPPCQIP